MRCDHLAAQRPSCGQLGELVRATQRLLRGAHPVLLESALKFRDQGAFDPCMDFAPVILGIGVAQPKIAETDTAGETDFPIDDENAPMGAAIRPINPPGAGGMVISNLAAGLPHLLDVIVVELRPGAQAIEQDTHTDTGAGAFAEGVAELTSDCAALEKKRFEVNAFFCRTDRTEERRKYLVSVME